MTTDTEGGIKSVRIKGVELRENVRVYFYQGQKWGVCMERVSLKSGSTVLLPCPANCSVDLHVTRMITGHWTHWSILQHMTVSLTTIKFEQKSILYFWLSFNAFSTNRYTIRLMYVIINGPVSKKNRTWAKGSGIIFPKIHWLTTSNCWKENEKVYNIQNNFDTKQFKLLIKLYSEIKWDYSTYEKRITKYIYKLNVISAFITVMITATIAATIV